MRIIRLYSEINAFARYQCGTAGAHVEDTTTTEESTAPSGGASIGAHVSETNEQSSRPLCTVEEILGAHPMNDHDFWVALTLVTCLLTQQIAKK